MVGRHRAMMLFVGRLPENITRKELKAFVQTAVKGAGKGRFSFKANVSNCTILRLTDRSNGDCEYHALVEIQPAKAAMRAIEYLNGREFKGARIEVRRYHHRSLLRDRRRDSVFLERPESRLQERRRRTLTIDLVDVVEDSPNVRVRRGHEKNLKIDLIGV